MTSGEVTAIALASLGVIGTFAPYAGKAILRRMGVASKADEKIAHLAAELADVRQVQARCESDRKTDRRIMRWLLSATEARNSQPPGPLASALAELFADETTEHEAPAE